jgi:hypothetical protein
MAKCGTSAVASGLRDAGAKPVFQVHDLDPEFLEREEQQYGPHDRPWRNWDAQVLLARPPTAARPWRVVSLVRDPIAQSISAYFQRSGGHVAPDAADEVRRRLHRLPLRWFETRLQPTLGIDVYAQPFDPDVGHAVLEGRNLTLLLLRTEGLPNASAVLREFFGTNAAVALPRANVSAEKNYADAYGELVASLRPPPAVIDEAYSSRLVRHFYTDAEIDGFRDRWSQ